MPKNKKNKKPAAAATWESFLTNDPSGAEASKLIDKEAKLESDIDKATAEKAVLEEQLRSAMTQKIKLETELQTLKDALKLEEATTPDEVRAQQKRLKNALKPLKATEARRRELQSQLDKLKEKETPAVSVIPSTSSTSSTSSAAVSVEGTSEPVSTDFHSPSSTPPAPEKLMPLSSPPTAGSDRKTLIAVMDELKRSLQETALIIAQVRQENNFLKQKITLMLEEKIQSEAQNAAQNAALKAELILAHEENIKLKDMVASLIAENRALKHTLSMPLPPPGLSLTPTTSGRLTVNSSENPFISLGNQIRTILDPLLPTPSVYLSGSALDPLIFEPFTQYPLEKDAPADVDFTIPIYQALSTDQLRDIATQLGSALMGKTLEIKDPPHKHYQQLSLSISSSDPSRYPPTLDINFPIIPSDKTPDDFIKDTCLTAPVSTKSRFFNTATGVWITLNADEKDSSLEFRFDSFDSISPATGAFFLKSLGLLSGKKSSLPLGKQAIEFFQFIRQDKALSHPIVNRSLSYLFTYYWEKLSLLRRKVLLNFFLRCFKDSSFSKFSASPEWIESTAHQAGIDIFNSHFNVHLSTPHYPTAFYPLHPAASTSGAARAAVLGAASKTG